MNELCQKTQQRIVAYIDGELSENEHQEIEVHLKTCQQCKQYEQEMRETDVLLRENISLDLPPEVDLTGIWEEIEPGIDMPGPSRWQPSAPPEVHP